MLFHHLLWRTVKSWEQALVKTTIPKGFLSRTGYIKNGQLRCHNCWRRNLWYKFCIPLTGESPGPHLLHSQHPLSQVVLLQIFGTITQVYDFATILIYSHLFLDIYIPPPSFFIPWSNPFDSPKITLVNIFYLFSHILPHYSILFNSRTPYSNNNFLLKVSCLSLFNCHHLIFGLKIDSHFGFILFNCISRTNSLCCVVTPCPRTTLQLVYNFLS